MSNMNIWDYYSKCDTEDGEKKARCLLCDNIFNYSSTIHNLKSHLRRRHSEDVTITPALRPKQDLVKQRKNNSVVWLYFSKLENENKLAVCNICDRTFSYKTTVTNLKNHLVRVHCDEYSKILKKNEDDSQEEDDSNTEEVYLELTDDDEDSDLSTQATEVFSFFEQETGGRARCVVCRATLPHRVKELKKHLKSNHPKLAQDFDDVSDNNDDQNNTYTEVVYLEDESRKSQKREAQQLSKRRHSVKSTPVLKKVKKRKTSSSSDEFLSAKNIDDNDEQIEKFGTYVTCLLKKMPKDVCSKLQMDIINLIMMTKLKLNSEISSENKVILDAVPVSIQPVNAMPGYIVTVPSSSDCRQQNVTVASGEVKCDPLTQNNADMPKITVTNTMTQNMNNC